LLEEYEKEWVRPIRSHVAKYEFCRGFIEKVTLSERAFVGFAAELARLVPIRELHIRPGWPRLSALLDVLLLWPRLPRLSKLALASLNLGDAGAQRLADCSALQTCTRSICVATASAMRVRWRFRDPST